MRQRTSRRRVLRNAGLAGLGLAGAAILGCSTQQKAELTATVPTAPTKVAGGSTPAPAATTATKNTIPKGKLTVAHYEDVVNTDGHQVAGGMDFQLFHHVHDGLLTLDLNGDLAPGLATDWKWEDNGKSLVLNLRKGVKFHNGDPFDAKDVKFSFDRQMDPATKSNFAYSFQSVDKLEVLDPYKVAFRFKDLDAAFLTMLDAFLYIGSKAYHEKVSNEEYRKMPMGTGPFKFVGRKIGEYYELEANADYWNSDRVPRVKNVVVKIVPDISTRKAMLQTGEADLISGVTPVVSKEIEGMANLRVVQTIGRAPNFIAFNTLKEGPFKNAKVRQALNYAVDKEAMIKGLFYGAAKPVATGAVPGAFGYPDDIKPYPYDVEKAKQLLAEAGYPNGIPGETKLYATAGSDIGKAIAQAVSGYLEKVGVKAQATVIETGTWASMMTGKKLDDMTVWAWPDWTKEATKNRLPRQFSSNGPWSYFANPNADALLVEANQTIDDNKRADILKKLYRILHDDAPYIHLFQVATTYGTGARVKEWKIIDGWTVLRSLEYVALKD